MTPHSLPRAPQTVDARAVERLRRFGGSELVRDMIELFLTHVPARVEAARRGLEVKDAMAVKLAAHALKSSCSQLGAARMRTICDRVELWATQGDLPPTASLLDELAAELTVVATWLKDVQQRLREQEAA